MLQSGSDTRSEAACPQKILIGHKLQVTDIATPLFKTDCPELPCSPQSEKRDQFHANFDANAQEKLLERCNLACQIVQHGRIRCFDFWRLDDQKPYRAAINAKTCSRPAQRLRERQTQSFC